MALVLHLHGSPSLIRPGQAPMPLAAREAALLAWLHLEGPTPRAPLAGRLWPGGGEAKARANLRQLLLRLRRAAGGVLSEDGAALRLAPEVQIAPAAGRLLGVLEFDDAPELAEWLDARRDAERRKRLREGLAQAREALSSGHLDEALAAADAVLLADPAAEEAHRLRMQVFWQRGDRAAAVEAWDDCRLALRAQFGVPPSKATDELGHRVLAEEAATQRPPDAGARLPEALQRPLPLVGRERERSRIVAALHAGQGVVVRGPGGIGKSRLLTAVADALQPSVWVGARPGDEHVPGAVASRLVRAAMERFNPALDAQTRADIQRLLPGAGAPAMQLESALEHRRVLASVARCMLACHAGGMRLVVVDDLQFSDDLSMDAMAVVIGGWLADPPARAAVPLFGCRPDELREPAQGLVRLLEASGRALRVELAPLDAEALATLLDHVPLPSAFADKGQAVAHALVRRVGGNPAHWVESLKSLWRNAPHHWQSGEALPVPDSLRAQVRQRLQRLSEPALQLAQLAAVAQREFTLPLAALGLGRAPLALAPLFAELDAAQVFERGGFAHDLVAEAVDASLPASLRAPLHRLVAEHLQIHAGEPAAVAFHLDAAGDVAAAAPWHQRAGEQARDQWRIAEAAQHFETAAQAFDRLPPTPAVRESRLACLRGAASARIGLGQSAAADALLEAAQGLSRTPLETFGVLNSRVTVWLSLGRLELLRVGAERIVQALEAPPAALLPAEHDRCWMGMAITARFTRLAPRALRIPSGHGRGLAQGVTAVPGASLTEALARGMLLRQAGKPAQALELLARKVPEAGRGRLFSQVFNASHQWVRAALSVGDLPAADEAIGTLEHAAREFGTSVPRDADLGQLRAMHWLCRAEPERAIGVLGDLQTLLASRPGARPHVQIATVAALALMALGRNDEARSRLDALPFDPSGFDADQAWRCWAQALLAWRCGESPEQWLARAAALDPNHDGVESLVLQARLMDGHHGGERAALLKRLQQEQRLPLLRWLQGDTLPPWDPWLGRP
jgi:DNA-binding SARP family transcriptional activator/tetratricopeptide (TPR) repeat protein